jgi:hypothetical protein
VVAAALALTIAQPVYADSLSPSAYRQTLQDAYNLIQYAQPDDSRQAARALAVLQSGIGDGQPEIAADLASRPPDYQDARARLLTLLTALDQPAGTSDPALAQSRLHQVLGMSRYGALHRPPSLIDRVFQWVRDRLADLAQFLQGRGLPPIPGWYLASLGVLILAAVAAVVFLSARRRLGAEDMSAGTAGYRAPSDRFAEADRLAAGGDRVGAIRALCAGVAGTLAGERTWEGSPLTVREIFQSAPDAVRLRPLLLPFEAAVYGGRGVDEATYARAAQVAYVYRRPAEVTA